MEDVILKTLRLLLCAAFLHPSGGQLIRDTRCFLETGATAAHLFVGEDAEVGATIGVLGVLGDPGPHGDIELRLREHDSPVAFSPHSRNLTLTRPLDKEGVDGPASVFVHVVCERKRALDPGFVIPVNIRVMDANDNAPRFVNAPYVLDISEVTVVGTRVLQGVRAVDADQPGPYSTIEYSVLPGPHADYFVFANALEGTLVLRKPLDYETLSNFSVGIRAQDQGEPPRSSETTLRVNVIDADDQNPAFLHEQYEVVVPRQTRSGTTLKVTPAPVKAVDRDVGIDAPVVYSIHSGELPFLALNPETAVIVATRPLGDHELLSTATVVIKATQTDNPDRYALATVAVSREGAPRVGSGGGVLPVKFVLEDYSASVPENAPPGSVILTAGVNKVVPNLRFWLEGAAEDLERFSITSSGELILKGSLDYERRIQHSFLIHVTDGRHNDTSRVNVSVEDVNEWEPRFRHPRYELHARTLREGSIVGRLEAADGDRGDRVMLSLRGPDARSFEIRDNGELILRSAGPINGTLARVVAVATDTGRPPRSSMVPIIVHLPNTGSLPIAVRAAPAWLGSSVLLVAVFGAVLGLLGVVILVLILYIYKHKRPKSGGSVASSAGTGYREKSPVPSALSPTPRILGASALREVSDESGDRRSVPGDIDNPVFGDDIEGSRCATLESIGIVSARQVPLYARRKVAPAPSPPTLAATSNIPHACGGLVRNMNDLSARTNPGLASRNSSNCSADPPDSLAPAWPTGSVSRRVKKLSWDDDEGGDGVVGDDDDDDDDDNGEDDRIMDNAEATTEVRVGNGPSGSGRPDLTVYF